MCELQGFMVEQKVVYNILLCVIYVCYFGVRVLQGYPLLLLINT